jgi:hypothetical protein
MGRLLYMTTASRTERALQNYRATNRDITVYTLNLDAEKKARIRAAAEKNVLPENRVYLYNHFKDNCVTQILYLLDDAIDGQFSAFAAGSGRFTLREHVRRHTWFSPFWDWFLNFLMGKDIDTPTTMWQEMFLPSEVGRNIEHFSYTDPLGATRPLVSAVEIVNRSAGRPAVLDAPRKQWLLTIPAGLFLALIPALLMFVGRQRQRHSSGGSCGNYCCGHVSRVTLGLYQALLGLFFGICGSLLFFLSLFTNHDYTWHNINVLFVNPLFFCALFFGLALALSKSETRRRFAAKALSIFWMYVFVGGLVSAALKIFPPWHQQNHVTLVLLLPCALVLALSGLNLFTAKSN